LNYTRAHALLKKFNGKITTVMRQLHTNLAFNYKHWLA